MLELLTTDQMSEAERETYKTGLLGIELMEAAGQAVVDVITQDDPEPKRTLVLCGPGNNGGDGLVVARLLRERGWIVKVCFVIRKPKLALDALEMAEKWKGETVDFSPDLLDDAELIIDAIFGAGLTREIDEDLAEIVDQINESDKPIISIDIPTGIDGNTGEIKGVALKSDRTVTFFRLKPGHLIFPGREYSGFVTLKDIGIKNDVLSKIDIDLQVNDPSLWSDTLPLPAQSGHKYHRGHALVISGPQSRTGAARLGARGALRIGAGLVTMAATSDAMVINAVQLTAIMLREYADTRDLEDIVSDERIDGILVGPAFGVGLETEETVLSMLSMKGTIVLDADALTSFEGASHRLFNATKRRKGETVLTPHDGEYTRLFGQKLAKAAKLERAREAAKLTGAIVVLKGPDTIIAAPDGRTLINDNAPPWLATAGSGDVLAGFILGLCVQGMPAFEAASAAVWLHGQTAKKLGLGMIAEDLTETLPQILQDLIQIEEIPLFDDQMIS